MARTRTAKAVRSARRFEQLRESVETEGTQRLVLATLKIRIPKRIWLSSFSARHPHARIEILNRGELGNGLSVSDYWISGAPPGEYSAEIAKYPDVTKSEALGEVGEGCLYRVTFENPPVVDLYRRLRMPIPFPMQVQNGLILWEVVAREPDFETIMRYARRADPALTVVSIRRKPLQRHLPMLSDAQRALLSQAMAEGYFAVPRQITLTDLAAKLNRSKSGISESLAIIEQKLLESVMRTPIAVA